jgi:aminoglycoside phosphotransferase (APT) family kinase protein
MFGATLVSDDDGGELVLKVRADPSLAPTWATGAEMAARLRATGYPAPVYRGTGCTESAVWSLQEPLPGAVAERLEVDLAEQLVALACRHAIDSGRSRPWRDDAIAAARGWLAHATTQGLDDAHVTLLTSALDAGARAELLETTIVHTDFHFRNCLVEHGAVAGVVDWEIAGPGDWRFDLVNCVFWCLMFPNHVDEDATALILDAVAAECPADVSALMFACQALRTISMRGRVGTAERRIVETVAPHLGA